MNLFKLNWFLFRWFSRRFAYPSPPSHHQPTDLSMNLNAKWNNNWKRNNGHNKKSYLSLRRSVVLADSGCQRRERSDRESRERERWLLTILVEPLKCAHENRHNPSNKRANEKRTTLSRLNLLYKSNATHGRRKIFLEKRLSMCVSVWCVHCAHK